MHNHTNALPYLLAYPAFLAGHQTIQEALNDQLLQNYLSAFVEADSPALAESVASPTPLDSLCADGAPRLPTYILPTLLNLLAQNQDVHRMAFLVATYGHYLSECYARSMAYAPTETTLQPGDWARIISDDVVAFLSISSLAPAHLYAYPHFVTMYRSYRTQIAKYGVGPLLRQMAYNCKGRGVFA